MKLGKVVELVAHEFEYVEGTRVCRTPRPATPSELIAAALPHIRERLQGEETRQAVWDSMYQAADGESYDETDAAIEAVLRVLSEGKR